jgi:hypothetical protein
MAWIRLRLFFGTLKIKPRRQLRREELNREIPVKKIGWVYVTWRPRSFDLKQGHDPGQKRLDAPP